MAASKRIKDIRIKKLVIPADMDKKTPAQKKETIDSTGISVVIGQFLSLI